MGDKYNGNCYKMCNQEPISWKIPGMTQEKLSVDMSDSSLCSALADHTHSTSDLLLVSLPRSLDIHSMDGAKVSLGDEERPLVKTATGEVLSAQVSRVSPHLHKCVVGPRLRVASRPISACLSLSRSFSVPEVRLPAPVADGGGGQVMLPAAHLKFRNLAFGRSLPRVTSPDSRDINHCGAGPSGECSRDPSEPCSEEKEYGGIDSRLHSEVADRNDDDKLAKKKRKMKSVGLDDAASKRSKMSEKSPVYEQPARGSIRVSEQVTGVLGGRRKDIQVDGSPTKEYGDTLGALDDVKLTNFNETMTDSADGARSHSGLSVPRKRNKKRSGKLKTGDLKKADAAHEGSFKSAKRTEEKSSLGEQESVNAAYNFLLSEQEPEREFQDRTSDNHGLPPSSPPEARKKRKKAHKHKH